MLQNAAKSIQQAFFNSLEQAGCLSLETTGPDSSDDEYEDGSDEEKEDSGNGPILTPSRLVGFGSFLRDNPRTDKFKVKGFHHMELWCGDASSTWRRFSWALGLPLIAKSDQTTGNQIFCSYVLQSESLTLCFTAPYSSAAAAHAARSASASSASGLHPHDPPLPVSSMSFSGSNSMPDSVTIEMGELSTGRGMVAAAAMAHSHHHAGLADGLPFPKFSADSARKFFEAHGLAVRAVAVEVEDATLAYTTSIAGGAIGVCPPFTVTDANSRGSAVMSEVQLYGDVVLRYVEAGRFQGSFLPNYEPASNQVLPYGSFRLDHVVGNVPALQLQKTLSYIKSLSGFHDLNEPSSSSSTGLPDTTAAAGASSASLSSSPLTSTLGIVNSGVLANDFENVVLPILEPSPDLPHKSQVELFLEHNGGAGVQHLAFMSSDLVKTVQEVKARSGMGGFSLLPRPSAKYYREAAARVGDAVTAEELRVYQEQGILLDVDDRGVILQVFTAPVGDRPTLFIEILQRKGASSKLKGQKHHPASFASHTASGGCGGLGPTNLLELFRAMSQHQSPVKG